MDLLLDILDIKPEVIINYAAQGEGALKKFMEVFETNCMITKLTENLMNKNFNKFIQIGTSEMWFSGSCNKRR